MVVIGRPRLKRDPHLPDEIDEDDVVLESRSARDSEQCPLCAAEASIAVPPERPPPVHAESNEADQFGRP